MTQAKGGIRLLLVDDEQEFLESMAAVLGRRGFDIETAQDGYEALEILEKKRFDVGVIDVKMPGLDGVELFREIKLRHSGMPVILLTGHGTLQQAFNSSREGVFEYLTKPCSVGDLVQVVRRAVEGRSPDEEMSQIDVKEVIRVMLVDDETEFVDGLAKVLNRRGMKVTTAAGGADALERLRIAPVDVMVCDVRMPGMDGLEVLRRMKNEQPLTEILLLTGHPSIGNAFEGIRDGAFDYLMKPYEIDGLVKKIQAAYLHREERVASERDRGAQEAIEKKRGV